MVDLFEGNVHEGRETMSMFRRVLITLVLLLGATQPATAGEKKKKPKPKDDCPAVSCKDERDMICDSNGCCRCAR